MPVVNNYFAHLPKRAFLKQVVSRLVTGIPGCFIIDQHVYIAVASGIGHRERVAVTHCERFFHHDVNPVTGALFDDSAVIERVRIDNHGGWVNTRDHVA